MTILHLYFFYISIKHQGMIRMSGKEFIGSIAISFIAIGAVALFALPLLYPAMQTNMEDIQTGLNNTESDITDLQSDITDLQSDITDLQSEDKGIVLQTRYQEFFSTAQISDDDTGAYISVPDTELDITIQSNSRLTVIFSGRYSLGLSTSLLAGEKVAFNITLSVFNSLDVLVGNRTARLSYKTDTAIGSQTREISGIFYLDYVTSPLSAGTYTVALSWVSLYDTSGQSYFIFTTPSAYFPRSIRLIEYKS
jgi:hypothetical protein